MARVAMLLHAYYEEDPRVRKEAEALAAAGFEVEVFALRSEGRTADETIEGVLVHRLPVRRHQGAGLSTYLAEYTAFAARATWALFSAHRRRPIDVVITHSPPDWLAFAALPLRLAGVPLVLDLHEASPEFFRVRFGARSRVARLIVGIVGLAERWSAAISTAVIATTPKMVKRLVARGVPARALHLVPNLPIYARFAAAPLRPYRADGVLRLLYTGALTPIYELEVVIEAVRQLRAEGMRVELDLYGRGDNEAALRAQVIDAGMSEAVRFHDRVPLADVPALHGSADIALAPTRRDAFTELTISNKAFEGAAAGRLVIASALPTLDHFDPAGAIVRYPSGDAAALAAAIRRLDVDPFERDRRLRAIDAFARTNDWATFAPRYVSLIRSLLRRPATDRGSR